MKEKETKGLEVISMQKDQIKEKGITLIALVVTIVVLLILAGVSINLVLGDNGIVKKAQEAKTKSAEGSARDNLGMLLLEYPLSSEYGSLEAFLNAKKASNELDAVTKTADGKFEVEKDGYIATINADGAIADFSKAGPRPVVSNIKVVDANGAEVAAKSTDEGTPLKITFNHSIEGGTTTVSPSIPYTVTENGTYEFTVTGTVDGNTSTKKVSVTVNQYSSKYKIGDYVNYTYDDAENYVLTSAECGSSANPSAGIAQTKNLKWRILNIDETAGTVDLVSENPTDATVYFGNILGYNNGPYIMNKICEAQYSNSSLNVKARSINLLDMEKHLTPTGISNRNAHTNAVKYGTTKTYTTSATYGDVNKYPSLYANQKGAGVNVLEANATSIEQPDITKGNDPYEESKKIAETEPTTDSTYGTGNPLTVTQTQYNIYIGNGNYGDAGDVLKSNNTYWVASRFVDTSSNYAYFGLRYANTVTIGNLMFDSYGRTYNLDGRLRPVVSLSSSILSETKDSTGAWNLIQ